MTKDEEPLLKWKSKDLCVTVGPIAVPLIQTLALALLIALLAYGGLITANQVVVILTILINHIRARRGHTR